jgi:hypothetical protein
VAADRGQAGLPVALEADREARLGQVQPDQLGDR